MSTGIVANELSRLTLPILSEIFLFVRQRTEL